MGKRLKLTLETDRACQAVRLIGQIQRTIDAMDNINDAEVIELQEKMHAFLINAGFCCQ